ncbi:hypothetical protein LTS18_014350, partial [Coniosporium uncinatum]
MSTTTTTHNIIILGGSCAGLSAAHYFLKHVLPPLRLASSPSETYHVYLINPSSSFFYRPASPRAL